MRRGFRNAVFLAPIPLTSGGGGTPTFTMSPNPATYTNADIPVDDLVSFALTSGGVPSTIEWQYSADDGVTWFSFPAASDQSDWQGDTSDIYTDSGSTSPLIRAVVDGIESDPQTLTIDLLAVDFYANTDIYSTTIIELNADVISSGDVGTYSWYIAVFDADHLLEVAYTYFTGSTEITMSTDIAALETFFGIGPLVGKYLGVSLHVSEEVEGPDVAKKTKDNYLSVLEDPIGTVYPFYSDGTAAPNFSGQYLFQQYGIGARGLDSPTTTQSGAGGGGGGWNGGKLNAGPGNTFAITVPFEEGQQAVIIEGITTWAIVDSASGATNGYSSANASTDADNHSGGIGGDGMTDETLAIGGGGAAGGWATGPGDNGGDAPMGYGGGNGLGTGGSGGWYDAQGRDGGVGVGPGSGGGGGGYDPVDGQGFGGAPGFAYTVFTRNS